MHWGTSQICHVCFLVTLCGKEADSMEKHGIYLMHVLVLPGFQLLFGCGFVLVFKNILISLFTRYVCLLLMFNCADILTVSSPSPRSSSSLQAQTQGGPAVPVPSTIICNAVVFQSSALLLNFTFLCWTCIFSYREFFKTE